MSGRVNRCTGLESWRERGEREGGKGGRSDMRDAQRQHNHEGGSLGVGTGTSCTGCKATQKTDRSCTGENKTVAA